MPSIARSHKQGDIYFHSPCFDGIVSCVLAWEFLEAEEGWAIDRLHPVNYDFRRQWLRTKISKRSAVVDFLYHPDAIFWVDHHLSTFLTKAAKQSFQRRSSSFLIYDSQAESCSVLLWDRVRDSLAPKRPDYPELVEWSRRIDSADYASVEEAIFGSHPALRINSSLVGGEIDYPEKLVRLLRTHTLEQVAKVPEVRNKTERVRSLMSSGLKLFRRTAEVTRDGIVMFDVDGKGSIVSRYAPFYFFPEARYSVGLTRGENGTKITAMRNPWRDFCGVKLGSIFTGIGGGGHERVASSLLPTGHRREEGNILMRIISEIRRREQLQKGDSKQLNDSGRVKAGAG